MWLDEHATDTSSRNLCTANAAPARQLCVTTGGPYRGQMAPPGSLYGPWSNLVFGYQTWFGFTLWPELWVEWEAGIS